MALSTRSNLTHSPEHNMTNIYSGYSPTPVTPMQQNVPLYTPTTPRTPLHQSITTHPTVAPIHCHLNTLQFSQHQAVANSAVNMPTVTNPATVITRPVNQIPYQKALLSPPPLELPQPMTNQWNNDNPQNQLLPIKWKFDFPKFNGNDPHEWIQKCEDFFFFHNTSKNLKVCSAGFAFEGEAGKWLRH
ncbi:hypothetical protein ZOSMA_32G00660 [Zostera marina]|uniref:Uncharacterized protein n=1 Tax=Zostera marina TaxID=29655 RepID=A0A0K9P8E2_ZOSMR|nr:hypothetical protein ZOSMA_32G00660 [Zostera marina]